MISVPRNTYISQLKVPVGSNLISDPRQFTGETFSYVPGTCPKGYSVEAGVEYCLALCVNSCPQLHPDALKGSSEQLAQAQNSLEAASDAVDLTAEGADVLNTPITVTGVRTFAIPDGALPSDIAAVGARIGLELAGSVNFNLSISVCLKH